MDNVARISDVREVDVREEQSSLYDAEAASLSALEQYSNLGAALVKFVRKTEFSVMHPKVRAMLKRYPALIEKATSASNDLCEFHRMAHSLAENTQAGQIVMSGGLPKEPHAIPPKDL